MNWKEALYNIPAKGYRQTRNGRYEAFISNHSKTIMLGTHDTPEEAEEAVFNYRSDRLLSGLDQYGLDPDDGVIYQDNYIAFRNGMIFNLRGEPMRGNVNKSGYRQGIFNGHTRDHHKVLADCFIENPDNLRDVNHKNGNKLDLNVSNLERTTHADNIIHAYKNGLITIPHGEAKCNAKLNEDIVRYIRASDKSNYALSKELGVDSATIRDARNGKSWRYVK